MFLKSSLEEKLKRSLSEYNSPIEERLQKSNYQNKSVKLRTLQTKNDSLSFPRDHKKFNDDDVSLKAREAKKYVKALIDPDILELRKKQWNISAMPEENKRPELKQTLFEVSHGLSDFKVVMLKENKVELGTDTRNFCYEGWNGSTLLEQLEKKQIIQENFEAAKANTANYWKKNQNNRVTGLFVDLIDESNRGPSSKKVFKKYKNPVITSIDYNRMIGNIKRETMEMREKIKKQ